jgi:predicted lipoprotein with Yx(FWY)xxD motif
MIRKTYALALFAAVAAIAIAGCGGSSSSTESSASSETNSSEAGASTLTGTSISGLGNVLVDSEGFTVYMFGKDKGTTSSCYGACAENWPPVMTKGSPSTGGGAMSSEIGTTKRKDGTVQVTYAGHPLYTFTQDSSPGEANGEEESTTSESSGGGGYSY